jgi:hypothetical protein
LKHLLNISAYAFDTQRHGGLGALQGMCSRNGLDGAELLTGHFTPDPSFQRFAVGVHLPYAVDWYSVWRGGGHPEHLDQEDVLFLSFGRDREAMIQAIRSSWLEASTLNPAYGVFHAGSPSLDRIYSQDFPYGDMEVLEALVDLLNQVVEGFPTGEPPFPLMLENLWWPGLRLLDKEEVMVLERGLNFQDWGICLDVGHLMNSLRECRREDEATDAVLRHLSSLPSKVLDRVKVMHLHMSLSAQYQEDSMRKGESRDYLQGDVHHRLREAFPHFSAIDWHAPFQNRRCQEIVTLVHPDFVTHEFICPHPEDMESKLRCQLAHFQDRNAASADLHPKPVPQR